MALFQRILVLLDGSGRAELALPVAVRLVRATGASLLLLRMVTLPPDYVWYKLEPPFLAHTLRDAEILKASTYLKGKAWEMDLAGIPVHTHLMPDLPLEQIHAFVAEQAIDLVILCNRGHITCRPRTQRSMAQQVLRHSAVPVLILQETLGPGGMLSPRDARSIRFLISLDGSALAEAALPPAAELASALSAPLPGMLHLLRVLPSDFIGTSERSRWSRERAREYAQVYLQTVGRALYEGTTGRLNLELTASVLFSTDVAETIVRVAEGRRQEAASMETSTECDAIALTTHGRSGLHHLRLGDTPERVLQQTCLPVLVVHPTPDQRPPQEEAISSREQGVV